MRTLVVVVLGAVAAVASIGLLMLMFIPLAKPILVVGFLTGIPLMLIGMGLTSFGQGMQEFAKIVAASICPSITNFSTLKTRF